jgi:hypothetical protein
MFRDKGPMHNMGHGVNSRDMPSREGETETPSPNSGYIAKALDGHPVMRFLAATGTAMLVTTVASRVTKKGGLRLGQAIQKASDHSINTGTLNSPSTRLVKGITDLRRGLDELQGVSRQIDGVDDPYQKIVFDVDGKLTTGYEGRLNERAGFRPLSKDARQSSSRGLTSENAEAWTYRDEIQKQLVRAGRRIPYELPALYVAQRGITEPLFAHNQDRKKVNWYNPADVVSDFVTQSVFNVATITLPFAGLGAAGAAGKSSLTTLANSMNDLNALSPIQKKSASIAVDLRSLLSEVGHDASDLINKGLKLSSQTSGAFSAAVKEMGNAQPEFAQTLYASRRGAKAAIESLDDRNRGKFKTSLARARGFFLGAIDENGNPVEYSAIDLLPGLKGSAAGFTAAKNNFKSLGVAHDVVSGRLSAQRAEDLIASKFSLSRTGVVDEAVSLNKSLNKLRGLDGKDPTTILERAINQVQSQHSSSLTRFAQGFNALGKGGPTSSKFKRGEFYQTHVRDAYKDELEKRLIASTGVDRYSAQLFVSQINISSLPSARKTVDATKRISIGRKIDLPDTSEEFFDTILKRFERVKGGENFASAIGGGSALQKAINEVDSLFIGKEFTKNLEQKIASNWNSFYKGNLASQASEVLKPSKQSFGDFVKTRTESGVRSLPQEKEEFLIRKTAQTLGVPLQKSDGKLQSISQLKSDLLKKNIDSTDTDYMRDFLLGQGKLKTGFFQGTSGLFGLRPLLVDEAVEKGMFKYLPEGQQASIKTIASAQSTFDPVTGGLGAATQTMGQTTLKGVYQTRTGDILDFTKVTSMLTRAKDFLATDLKMPIIGFNPADMFGYRSLKEMRNQQPLQIVSSRSVQPFLPKGETRPDFYIFNRTKKTKGTLTAFTSGEAGQMQISKLDGLYRGVSSASTEMISRETRNAAGLTGRRVDEIAGTESSRRLRLKKLLDIDPEQPNSLFRLGRRFRTRKEDITNNNVLARILGDAENTTVYKAGGKRKSLKLNDDLNIYDESGSVRFKKSEVLSAVDSFRKRAFNFNIDRKIMQQLEKESPNLFTSAGVATSGLSSRNDFIQAILRQADDQPSTIAAISRMGGDPRALTRSFSRLQKTIDQDNFNVDRASSELFRYIAQKNQLLQTGTSIGSTTVSSVDDIFTQIVKTTRTMQREGRIGIDQATEARAFGVATLFNFSAFKSYSSSSSLTDDAANSLRTLMTNLRTNREAASLFEAFSSGQVSMINSSIRRPLSRVIPPLSQRFGTAPYEINDLSVNVLGSGQQSTFVPTFGTVFARNPMQAVASAAGFGTYKNQQAFSTGSVPVAHMFGRLNKYFGTFGMQLDQSQYGGPVDLYMRGMVGKRVLPIAAGGAAVFTADRTIGGMVNEKDDRGERVYSPFFTTKIARAAVEGQSIGAGLVPGGMSYEEKKDQLLNGEVAIRQGRYWPLGTTPFEGGKVLYHRPSYYRKLKEGSAYTSDSWKSPMEKLAFGYDFSPLRPFDPYRFERQHYYNRPYPVTGEYFSGPFGPAVPLLNMTVGKILKPKMEMHANETAAGLANYVRVGESGAYDTSGYLTRSTPSYPSTMNSMGSANFSVGGYGGVGSLNIAATNSALSNAAGPLATASRSVTSQIGSYNNSLLNTVPYGPPKVPGVMTPPIVSSRPPSDTGSFGFQGSELAYRLQETAGIYGFAFGAVRGSLGLGSQDFSPQTSMLQSATKGYSTTRSFWDLNLGGLGDVPLAGEGALGNLEISEIVRRFIPKERNDVNYINPIANTMGQQYPFLPGPEYFTNFKQGDPFSKISEGEIRLPGVAYERFNNLYSDETGRYGKVNQLDILADVAPYSTQFRSLNRSINMGNIDPGAREKVQEIRLQAEEMTNKYKFSPYKYKGTSAEEMNMNPALHKLSRAGEYIAHRDTYFNTKLLNRRTAVEDWERRNVYGSTFPEWQRPYESFIEPMIDRASQRNPLTATATLATAGSFFGRTPAGKTFGSLVGGLTGLASSTAGNLEEMITGQRAMPQRRKKEIALEEYVDILSYVKNSSLSAKAQAAGDSNAAAQYRSAASRTMYGADIYGGSIETLSLSVPKRKREHFKAMINAPEEERERILSTAGRLERRIYQAAWGMRVEEKPDLAEYFTRHELPDQSWEGWHPNTSMDHVKIKTGQQMGLEMSQMGYYPQQIQEANLANPSYPSFFGGESEEDNAAQLRAMMSRMNLSGSVTPVRNPYGSNSINISAGVR